HQLWDIAFQKHIMPKCRHLLMGLFFCSQYGVTIDETRFVFNVLHPALCKRYGISHDPKDFEESLRVLEGSFLTIRGTSVSFLNPSIRDYLNGYLSDLPLLVTLASAAPRFDWAKAVWRHVQSDYDRFTDDDRNRVARAFVSMARRAEEFPIRKQDLQP